MDGKRFDQRKTLKIVRKFYKPNADNPESAPVASEFQGVRDSNFAWTMKLDPAKQPGFYQSHLEYGDGAKLEPPTSWGQVFNVDTKKESNLQRASQDDLDSSFMRQVGPEKVGWRPYGDTNPDQFVNKAWDLSEWPLFFLIFIAILVAEQALAVHLSFHLKTSEAELPTQVTQPQARAA